MAKVENYIKEAEEIMKEGREKLCRKMRCKGEKHRTEGTAILARCDKLWEMKSRQEGKQKIIKSSRNVVRDAE